MLTDIEVGSLAVTKDGETVKIVDVDTRIKVQDLDGEIKECYYTDMLFLWEE
jgi:hypothetical protein